MSTAALKKRVLRAIASAWYSGYRAGLRLAAKDPKCAKAELKRVREAR